VTPKTIIKIPASFPYESDKAVPWKYNSCVEHVSVTKPTANKEEELASNITSTQQITCSGRVYAPETYDRTEEKR